MDFFLVNWRRQRVFINGVSSSWGNVISGVLQGSVFRQTVWRRLDSKYLSVPHLVTDHQRQEVVSTDSPVTSRLRHLPFPLYPSAHPLLLRIK